VLQTLQGQHQGQPPPPLQQQQQQHGSRRLAFTNESTEAPPDTVAVPTEVGRDHSRLLLVRALHRLACVHCRWDGALPSLGVLACDATRYGDGADTPVVTHPPPYFRCSTCCSIGA
jgi:hypothetical protein